MMDGDAVRAEAKTALGDNDGIVVGTELGDSDGNEVGVDEGP